MLQKHASVQVWSDFEGGKEWGDLLVYCNRANQWSRGVDRASGCGNKTDRMDSTDTVMGT